MQTATEARHAGARRASVEPETQRAGVTAAAATQPDAPSRRHPRRDIQGLRAVAVLAVVLDHVLGRPSGGFVGVDVFFVISGYLITGLLLRELTSTGTISFSGFYRRRFRRIVPAASIVLAVTLVGSFLLLGRARAVSVLGDTIAAALFSVNWRLAIMGTDYFQSGGPVSPVQHFWSLSVEEQFYVVWPALLLLATAIVAGRRHTRALRRRRAVGVVVAAVAVTSFTWAVFESNSSPTVAYFSTAARAWELALGAGLSVAAPVLTTRIPNRIRPGLAWLGLAMIVAAVFVTSSTRGFPAPGALLPTLGAAVVIAAGTGGARRFLWPITNPVARYLGDASYSIYLWHFPVYVVAGPYVVFLLGRTTQDALSLSIVLGIVAVLSIASYQFVERPILAGRWLLPRQVGALTVAARRRRRPFVWAGVASVATIALVGVAVVVIPAAVTPGRSAVASSGSVTSRAGAGSTAQGAPAASPTASSTASPTASPGITAAAGTLSQKALTSSITKALDASAWPANLTPTVGSTVPVVLPGNTARCGGAVTLPAAECTFGDLNAPHKAVLVGDSIAQAYVPALMQIFGTGDWSLQITSMYSCPFIDRPIGSQAARRNICQARKSDAYAAVAATKPDVVIVSNTYMRDIDPTTGLSTSEGAWNAAFASMISTVSTSTSKIVLLPPPPYDKDINSCYTTFSGPISCVSEVGNSSWLQMANDQKTIVDKVKGSFIDTRPMFCNANGQCPAFVGSTLVKGDRWHPTLQYVDLIEPALAAAFQKTGVLSTAAPTASATAPAATSSPTP